MTKGRIEIRKLNLLGYTPDTQVYFIQNAGGNGSVETSKFLNKNKKYFQLTLHCGQYWYALSAPRINKFREYAEANGFETIIGN